MLLLSSSHAYGYQRASNTPLYTTQCPAQYERKVSILIILRLMIDISPASARPLHTAFPLRPVSALLIVVLCSFRRQAVGYLIRRAFAAACSQSNASLMTRTDAQLYFELYCADGARRRRDMSGDFQMYISGHDALRGFLKKAFYSHSPFTLGLMVSLRRQIFLIYSPPFPLRSPPASR